MTDPRLSSWPGRKLAKIEEALELGRLVYCVVQCRSSLRFGQGRRAPAMRTGVFKRSLTLRETSWAVPAVNATSAPLTRPYGDPSSSKAAGSVVHDARILNGKYSQEMMMRIGLTAVASLMLALPEWADLDIVLNGNPVAHGDVLGPQQQNALDAAAAAAKALDPARGAKLDDPGIDKGVLRPQAGAKDPAYSDGDTILVRPDLLDGAHTAELAGVLLHETWHTEHGFLPACQHAGVRALDIETRSKQINANPPPGPDELVALCGLWGKARRAAVKLAGACAAGGGIPSMPDGSPLPAWPPLKPASCE